MKLLEEYTRRAKECRELALKADTPEDREAIQHISETWLKLAAQRLDSLKNEKPKVGRTIHH